MLFIKYLSGLITMFVPCITIGQNTENSGQGSFILGFILALIPTVNIVWMIFIRNKTREQFAIEVS